MKKSIKSKVTLPHFKRGNLVEMVFVAIRDEILSGKFKPGEKLDSQEIFCKEFGVSRTVVREAWNKLASIGLIKTIHGHGSFVSHPDASNILDPICDAIQLDKNSTQDLLESRFLEDYTKIPGTSQNAISYHKRIIRDRV
jgi:DNA-binding FadR family transcriptional regulator